MKVDRKLSTREEKKIIGKKGVNTMKPAIKKKAKKRIRVRIGKGSCGRCE